MDTRWKKFKYSKLNKALCVLIACIAFAFAAVNAVQIMRCSCALPEDVMLGEAENTYYNSYDFRSCLNTDLSSAVNEARVNVRRAEFDKEKAEELDEALNEYKNESRRGLTYEQAVEEWGDDYVNDYDAYLGKNGLYYHDMFYFSRQNYLIKCNYGLPESEFKSLALETMNGSFDKGVSYNEDVKNLQYYVKCDDGMAATNVENPDEFIADIKNGVYIISDHGKAEYSKGFDSQLYDDYFVLRKDDCVVYASVDPSFSGDDVYRNGFEIYQMVKDINVVHCFTALVICLILTGVFFVISIRLAGNTSGGEIETSRIDSIPHDLHFALSAAAGAGVGAAVLWAAFYLTDLRYSSALIRTVAKYEDAIYFALGAAGVLFYLIITEFVLSLSRSVKSERSTFKNLLIVKICMLIKKGFVRLFGGAKKGSSAIKRGMVKIRKAMRALFYYPKRLNIKAILLLFMFTFTSVCLGFSIVLMTDEFFIGFIISLFLAAFNALCIFLAVRYMHSLDKIVDLVDKNQPICINPEELPNSLAILASGYQQTQQKLDEAVAKAIKDEHLKTELITNVSHDLKTPLTSVINYIDLLKKCDIDDETAKKYMDVIDEKSGKLKRLIEDLIEASKVTTGNVTLNKTLINLNELADQAIVEETHDIEKAGLQIVFDEASEQNYAFADGAKVYRVLENLLSNARKYSALGSRIYARVFGGENYSFFEIKNISRAQLNITPEELTERFIRGDKSRNEEGNGLGLSIAKELCTLNGGELLITIDGDLFKATVKLPKSDTTKTS